MRIFRLENGHDSAPPTFFPRPRDFLLVSSGQSHLLGFSSVSSTPHLMFDFHGLSSRR